MFDILEIIAGVIAVILVFAPHEFAHAFVAYKNGDGTAKMMGRMTLNPLKHIDPMGFISCVLIGFGWANPVPINPSNFRKYKTGLFTTAIAGVVTNYIIAFLIYGIFACIITFATASSEFGDYVITLIIMVISKTFQFSLCSVVFNLLPFYPLDGFRIVEAFTREINPVNKFLRNYGNAILIILIVESFLCNLLVNFGVAWAYDFNVLNYVMSFAVNVIGRPIIAFWSLIF